MQFLGVTLQAARSLVPRLYDFYTEGLGLQRHDGDRVAVGETTLSFEPADGEPFYHFALLVPGDRFAAARRWAAQRAELLPGGDVDEVVFAFGSWDARAVYFHDPAGNIVELIAHRGVGENGSEASFDGSELLGFSEVGLVGELRELAQGLEQLDLRVWYGDVDEGLAFVGERARTLILAPEGRGWLPTGRPAGDYPVDVVLTGPPTGELRLGDHRISRTLRA